MIASYGYTEGAKSSHRMHILATVKGYKLTREERGTLNDSTCDFIVACLKTKSCACMSRYTHLCTLYI